MKTKFLFILCLVMTITLTQSALAQDPSPTPTSIFEGLPSPQSPNTSATLLPTSTVAPATLQATLVPPAIATATPALEVEVQLGNLVAQETSLADLSIDNLELRSLLGIGKLRFQLPSNWYLNGSNILYLNLEYVENAPSDPNNVSSTTLTSYLDVFLNDILIQTLTFDSTQHEVVETYPVIFPAELLNSDNQIYEVELVFRAEEVCRANSTSRLIMRSDLSYVHFEYQEQALALDLAAYPRPIYHGSLGSRTEPIWVILPANPTQADLEAGMKVMAGFGMLTFNDFQLNLRTTDTLGNTLPSDAHIILVGQTEDHALIDRLYDEQALPTQREGEQVLYEDQPIDVDDGILHIIANPENPFRNILIVTGQTSTALQKAATALTAPPSSFNLGGDTSLITATSAPRTNLIKGLLTTNDTTLAQLGIGSIILNGLGETTAEIDFNLPYNHQLTNEAYFELVFRYSALLEQANGILNVSVNNERPLQTIFLADTLQLENNLANTHVLYAPLSSRDLLTGRTNAITLNLGVDTDWNCNPPDDLQTWFSVEDTSRFYLPRQVISPQSYPAFVAWFPAPFNYLTDWSDLLIVLPQKPTLTEIQQFYGLMAYLATRTDGGKYYRPTIAFGELPEGLDLAQYNIIVLGRPSTNPFFETLNEHLPQPFAKDSDQPEQILDSVSYQLPPEYDLGIIQMVHSLWSPERLILVITGSSAAGQTDALTAILTQTAGYTQLLGDVVFVSGAGITAIDTTQLQQPIELFTAIPEVNQDATLSAAASQPPAPIYTVTPGPTPTATPSRTVAPTSSPTPLVSLTPVPTVITPIPTFTPLPPENLSPDQLESPPWINILAIITGVVIVLSGLFGVYTFYRSWRSNRI